MSATRNVRSASDRKAAYRAADFKLTHYRLTGLVQRADWEAIGQIGGMSFSTFVPIGRAEGLHPELPALRVSADAGWFDDQTIGRACSIISELSPADGAQLLQFAALDDARVILEMGFNFVIAIGPGLATSAIWDGLKYLLSRRKMRPEISGAANTRIELVTELPAGKVIGIVDTSDPDVVAQALAAYSSSIAAAAEASTQPRHVVVWNNEPGEGWSPR